MCGHKQLFLRAWLPVWLFRLGYSSATCSEGWHLQHENTQWADKQQKNLVQRRLHKCTHQNFTSQIITFHYVLLSSKITNIFIYFLFVDFTFSGQQFPFHRVYVRVCVRWSKRLKLSSSLVAIHSSCDWLFRLKCRLLCKLAINVVAAGKHETLFSANINECWIISIDFNLNFPRFEWVYIYGSTIIIFSTYQ